MPNVRDRSPVYRITGIGHGLREDIAGRQRRYLISMAVRTLCFVLAVVASGWLRWAFLAGAVTLPYFSVVFANGGREPNAGIPFTTVDSGRRQLPSGPIEASPVGD